MDEPIETLLLGGSDIFNQQEVMNNTKKTVTKTQETKKQRTKYTVEKKRQVTDTINWLKHHYCSCPEVCLPREIIYDHYLDFCRNQNLVATCKATFGKIIRNTFPEVTSKRLGARGQSKYHYNGIAIKHNAKDLYNAECSNAITRFSLGVSNKCELSFAQKMSSKNFSLNSKVGTMLPKFPAIEDLFIPDATIKEKVGIFLTMYRMHCQCVVDVTISGNFEEIRVFLLHFWQGCPDHLLSIFNETVTLDLISACDSILYKTLTDVLIPSDIINVPERLLLEIQNVAKHWGNWLECSLEHMPLKMRQFKMAKGKRFSNALKRNAVFLHLAQVSRPVFSEFTMKSLSQELKELETQEVMVDEISNLKALSILQHLAEKEFFIESLVLWLDDMVRKIIKKTADVTENARCSILQWVFTLKDISYFITERKSDNFNTYIDLSVPFHFISCLFQEYLMLAFETQIDQRQDRSVHAKLKLHFNQSVPFSIDILNSPPSCFLATKRKQVNEHIEMSKRHYKRQTTGNITKSNGSVDFMQLHPREQNNSTNTVKHCNSKSYNLSNSCHQFTRANASDSCINQFANKCTPMSEYNTILHPFTSDVPLAVNEQISLHPYHRNEFPSSHRSNVSYDYFGSDFKAGYFDAYNPAMIPVPSIIDLPLNHHTYSHNSNAEFKNNRFVI